MKIPVPRFATGLPRLFRRSVTTLDVEGDSVRLLAVKGRQVTEWGLEPLEPGLLIRRLSVRTLGHC